MSVDSIEKKAERHYWTRRAIALLLLVLSITVLAGWFFNIIKVLNVLPGSATMKVNTALMFFLIGVYLLIIRSNKTWLRIIKFLIIVILILTGLLTELQYYFQVNLYIDNLFIQDKISTQFPGRMSPATAFCFMLIGLSLPGVHSKITTAKLAAQYVLLFVTLVALVSFVAYLMLIPTENRSFFWNTMAVHTSLLFVLSSYAISLKNAHLGFTGLVTGTFAGSKLIRWLLPFIIFLPLTLSYSFLALSAEMYIERDFGMAIYTVLFIVLSTIYVSIISVQMNRTDQQRKKLLNSVRLRNKELEQFAYITSHDLQEPLQTVIGLVNVLEKKSYNKLDEHGKKQITYIKQGAMRMSDLIKGLLDYSRLGRDKKHTSVDCNRMLKLIRDDLDSLITKTHAKLETDQLPVVKGYKTELRVLFQNLITNAIKFREPGTNPVIRISAHSSKYFWHFKVKDNGKGIPPDHAGKIFRIYYRLNNDHDGLGLGLAYCRKIVQLHDGKIEVESEPGKGSTFYFTLKKRR